jgi:hypothetical protein
MTCHTPTRNNLCLMHDTTAVHFHHKKLACLNKIHYFSHGMTAEFNNMKNINFTLHEGFGVPGEWHFSATSHSNSVCDNPRGGQLRDGQQVRA